MENPVIIVFQNKIFLLTLFSWLTAQCIKIGLGVIFEKKFNFKWLLGTGGMPSAHAAAVTALAFSVGLEIGYDTPLFIATFVFAFITMFDAQGVRRAAGKQAAVLNKMVDELYQKMEIEPERLKELLGHTPIEVFAGAFLGMMIALIFGG